MNGEMDAEAFLAEIGRLAGQGPAIGPHPGQQGRP
jgi:hypothetical protein